MCSGSVPVNYGVVAVLEEAILLFKMVSVFTAIIHRTSWQRMTLPDKPTAAMALHTMRQDSDIAVQYSPTNCYD